MKRGTAARDAPILNAVLCQCSSPLQQLTTAKDAKDAKDAKKAYW
jgi:hypothetical protein